MKRFHLAIGAALASLGLLSGCQSCCDPCCCERPGLLSRLGLGCRSSCCNGGALAAMPVHGGAIDALPANGGCGCACNGSAPLMGDGPLLGAPPGAIPGVPPAPGPMPLTPTPAAPPLTPVPNGNLAQPTPATPSYLRK